MSKKRSKNKSSKIKGNSGIDGAILKYIDKKSKSGLKINRVFAHFGKKYTNEKIESALIRLETRNLVEFNENGKVSKKQYLDKPNEVIIGKVDLAKSGVAYIVVDGWDNDIKIPRKFTMNALNNDLVEVELTKYDKQNPEGKVSKIVKRAQSEFICRFQPTDGFGFAIAVNGSVPFDFFIPESYTKDAKKGDLVVVQVINWEDTAGKNPVGKIVEKLSGLSANEIEMRSILMEQGFNLVFPIEVIKETEKINDTISKKEIAERLDYRNELTFTIDPYDAKDFDDALSVKELENGNYEIGVHIADVSHYVRPGSALDKEAQLRATSVYLPDRVCPMLPEKLSNKVCSLRPDEEKCTFSVLFEFNNKKQIVNYTFAKTITKSNRRFTYEEVQEILENREGEYYTELSYLDTLAKNIRAERTKNGAINFESDEVRFKLDENAVPVEVYLKERKDAHLLVEDFMLLANTTVAKFFSKLDAQKANQGAVYRVHDKPDMQRLQQLSNIAKNMGHTITFRDEEQARDALNTLMAMVEQNPKLDVLGRLGIRSMAKAEYTTKNIGHYGLGFEYYTHFTSPIRRYPDVLVHRILMQMLLKEKPFYTVNELEELCKSSSMMERQAQKAEREAIKYKQVEYLSKYVGEEFDGVISGVIVKGFFVELIANKCEGFVSLQNMKEDFIFDEEHLKLIGTKSKTVYQIGNDVKVCVAKTNLKEKLVDFDIVK